jgi:hypothetical protein
MQLRYIDYTDFDHLVNTLNQDYKLLNNKIRKIEQTVRRTYGTIRKRTDSDHINWKSPVSGNIWSIYYIHHIHRNKLEIDFYPYTVFVSSRGEKEFLLLTKYNKLDVTGSKLTAYNKGNNTVGQNNFRDFLVKNNLFLIIYRGHFIDRFRLRTEFKEYDIFEVIFEFIVNPELFLVTDYQQDHDWMMYLHSYGVAMIKRENNYIVFDTFVAKHELKENQTIAIQNYLNGLNDRMYGPIVILLMNSDVWLEFVDKDRLLKFLFEVAERNQLTAKSFIEINLPSLTSLWGESFLDKFPFAKQPPV